MNTKKTKTRRNKTLGVAACVKQKADIAAPIILDSGAKAAAPVEADLQRDTYQREAYQLRKDLCEIAAAFNVGDSDSEEAKKRIIAVKAERDVLRAEVAKLQGQIGQLATLDTPKTHEKAKMVIRERPFWSPVIEALTQRTEDCIKLCTTVDRLNSQILNQSCELATERARLAKYASALITVSNSHDSPDNDHIAREALRDAATEVAAAMQESKS